MTFSSLLSLVNDVVWGFPTIALILATGLVLTVRLRGIQFTQFVRGFRSIFRRRAGAAGEVSAFAALCTALSATIGTGNIVGVATAIAAGGPGALLWMWIAAILGTATKFTECMLACKYREVKADGHILGGPFYTIERGMGARWRWLAKTFAFFAVTAGVLGIGTMTQVNGITSAINNAFDPASSSVAFSLFGRGYSWATVVGGAVVTVCAALVILGGLRRIARVSEVVVPFMAVVYVFLGLSALVMNATRIPAAFATILQGAFGLRAAAGGAMGFALKQMADAMQKGVARGIFSNEAGLGSAPIAASSAQMKDPVEQGLVSMTGTVIDTLVICTMTGLSIVVAGEDIWGNPELQGVALTTAAFSKVLGGDGVSVQFLLMLCLVFFAFTTILGWNYYSERCLEYLTGGRMRIVGAFRLLYILSIAIGPYMTVSAVWTVADITNGLMAIPNCVSLIVLSGLAARHTRDYLARYPTFESEEE